MIQDLVILVLLVAAVLAVVFYFRTVLLVLQEPVATAVLLGVAVVILFAPQMPDMLAGTRVGVNAAGRATEDFWRSLLVPVAAGLAGGIGWFWTRAALAGAIGVDDYRRWHANGSAAFLPSRDMERASRLPLLCAAVVATAPVVGLWSIGEGERIGYGHYVAVGFGFAASLAIWGFIRWTWWRKQLASTTATPPRFWRWHTSSVIAAAPGGWKAASVVLGLSAIGYLVLLSKPEWVEDSLHAPSAGLLAVALLIGPLTLSVALARDLCLVVLRLVARLACQPLADPSSAIEIRRPVTSWAGLVIVVGFSSLFGFWQREDRYVVPRLPNMLHEPVAKAGERCNPDGLSLPQGALRRPCFEPALRRWVEDRRTVWKSEAPMPLVIVATAGGASRAAAWTLSVMRTLDLETGGAFGRQLFAISAVSGGAVGAVSYLHALRAHPAEGGGVDWSNPRVLGMLEQISQGDLLTASLATYFLHDTLASVWGRLHPLGGIDRGRALEATFERHWRWPAGLGLTGGQERLGIVALQTGGGAATPHLLLNGTDRTTGRRVATSTFRFRRGDEILPGVDDFLSLLDHPDHGDRQCPDEDSGTAVCGQDVPSATAAHNAARFPFISPAGRFNVARTNGSAAERQLLDGGYFENYGAETALDLLKAVRRVGLQNVEPVIVVISNSADAWATREIGETFFGNEWQSRRDADRNLLVDTTVHCAADAMTPQTRAAQPNEGKREPSPEEKLAARRGAVGAAVPQLFAPFAGLFAVRGAQGEQALHRLRHELCPLADSPRPPALVHIAMPRPPKKGDHGPFAAPMNWVLNSSASRFMVQDRPIEQRLDPAIARSPAFDNPYNAAQAEILKERLGVRPVVAASRP